MKDKGNDIEYEYNILNNLSIGPMQINREYLPIKAFYDLNYISSRDDSVKILSGYAEIKNVKKDNLTYSFNYENSEETKIELPYLYYPYYEVKIDGKKVEFEESEKGLISIKLENQGDVVLKYKLTLITKVSYIISFISVILLII